MDAVLTKVTSAKDDMMTLTMQMRRDKATVDFMDYVGKALDVRIPDEKEEAQ
jgi:hypothetical protein